MILGLTMGAWGISTFLSKKAEGLQATISNLETHQARLLKTITELEKKTGGIVFMETQNGKFIVLPQGMNLKSGWTIGKLPAWKME